MKNSNNIYRMDGIGKVFKFTLTQTFKNKGYRFSYILMIAMMCFMGPISMLSASASEKAILESDPLKEENELKTIYVQNDTPVSFAKEDPFELKDTAFEKAVVSNVESIPTLTDTEIGLIISEGGEGYLISSIISDDSGITSLQLDELTKHIHKCFESNRQIYAGISDEQMELLTNGISTGKVYSLEDYLSIDSNRVPASRITVYSTVYSIIVMILVSLTVSYVITTVMEEKTSKLVENLLVSVRPLALVMGKIFAMMVYVTSMLVLGGLGSAVSTSIVSVFNKSEAAAEYTLHVDFSALFGLSPWKILILFVSLVLTYLMYSILAGILGSDCTKAEDVGPSVMIINILSIAGYISGMAFPSIDNPVLDKITCIIPFISSYVGPVYFVLGRVPFWVYLIGLALQIATIIFLFRLCAKVYRKLIVNDSKRLKFSEILMLSRQEAGNV